MKTLKLINCFLLFIITIIQIFSQENFSVGPDLLRPDRHQEFNIPDASIGKRYFAQMYTSPNFQFGKGVTELCTITNIGASLSSPFTGGLMNRNGVLYTWNQTSPYQLWSIDTITGVNTLVFNMIGVPLPNFTGLCYDETDVYGLATSLSASQIFRLSMTTGVCTPIGTPQVICAGGITMLCRRGTPYSLFVLDIVADNLYKFNKLTGTASLVGPLGVNINFGQDGNVDWTDNTFYAMAYSTVSELRKVDTATGSLGPVLCTYTAQGTGMAIIPAYGNFAGNQQDFCRTNISIPIYDHSTTLDSVLVNFGWTCQILDVNVKINNLEHTWDSDLKFYLRKGNTGVLIINQVGGSGDNFINTVLNDSSFTPISSGTAPFTGIYIPSNSLAPFNGVWSNGYWSLIITDTSTGDTGLLTNWCLSITYYNCISGIQTLEIPNYYHLDQNYPNPFNPSTTIKFGIPESGNVKLVVYDITGREIKVLMNEYKHPGTYESVFDAREFASGVYFYSLITERGVDTRKMLLIK